MTQTEPTASPFATPSQPTGTRSAPRGPIRLLLDLFSSVWLGVALLTLLFIYSAIGSSGVPIHPNILDPAHWVAVRQLRWFELTEFEWFHWWPFTTLIALICINLVVATLRRIPFNVINLGVWMIHTGIIVLAAGSVWYFGTKVEGDAPVNRRRIVASAPGVEPMSMSALPGNIMSLGTPGDDNGYRLQVMDIDPQWELLSGNEKGVRAYKISVRVQSKGGMFIRELIANRPEYTQDLVPSNDPQQPFARAVKTLGKPLVDEALKLSLDYDPQLYFYLMQSRAVYLRELDAAGNPKGDWVQRPIRGMPRYNDYIASTGDVWTAGETLEPDPLNVPVPSVEPIDPLPDATFHVSRYLRYAQLETRRKPSADAHLDPTANISLRSTAGQSQQYQLVAFDPSNNTALQSNLLFTWINSAADLEKLKTRVDPMIRFSVPGANVAVEQAITQTLAGTPDLEFTPIQGTEYAYRVENFQDNLRIGNTVVSVAIVQIKSPERTFTRWVFDDPARSRDMAMAESMAQHAADLPLDEKIQTTYKPGTYPPAPIIVAAGPGENDLAVLVTKATGEQLHKTVAIGESVPLTQSMSLVVDKYAARTMTETKPLVIPREQRDRNIDENLSMIHLDMPVNGETISLWLPYHMYAFSDMDEVLRRFPYRPSTITLPDGRKIEVMFSRERMALPAPVALDEFKVATHIGGFTGQTSSIMDWTSMITFATQNGWTQPKQVSVNKPSEFNGFWFFQAQWDPPDRPRFDGDPPSRGLNYTVLGVGNRNGVHVQLAGCVIAVLGMIMTFYVRPIIKRRRQSNVYAQAAAKKLEAHAQRPAVEAVGAAWKVES